METKVYEDEWHGTSSRDIEYTTSDPRRVAESIDKLDGQVKTSVSLARGDDMLCIGGGNDGRYMAYFAHNIDEQLFNLVNADVKASGDEVKIVTGGQAGLFSQRASLDKKSVVEAASHFVATGEMAPHLAWDKG